MTYDIPTTAEIREQLLWEFDGAREVAAGEAFDAWLAAHEADVAAKERALIRDLITGGTPYDAAAVMGDYIRGREDAVKIIDGRDASDTPEGSH